MFRVKPRATLGVIFFTVLIQKSEKQLKVLSGCLKNLPSGIPWGLHTFPWGCGSRESLITLGNSLEQIFLDNHSLYPTTPAGHILPGSEAWSLTNSGKALEIVWKFAHGRSLGNKIFPQDLPRTTFSIQLLQLFHCLSQSCGLSCSPADTDNVVWLEVEVNDAPLVHEDDPTHHLCTTCKVSLIFLVILCWLKKTAVQTCGTSLLPAFRGIAHTHTLCMCVALL